MKKFVYIEEDVSINDMIIRKNEIGIIDSTNRNTAFVTFVCNGIRVEIDNSLLTEFDPAQTGDQYSKKSATCVIACWMLKCLQKIRTPRITEPSDVLPAMSADQ